MVRRIRGAARAPGRLALLSALASLAYLTGSSPCAGSWLCRPSGWPMPTSSRAASLSPSLAGLVAPRFTPPAATVPTRSVEAVPGAHQPTFARSHSASRPGPAPASGHSAGGATVDLSDLSQPDASSSGSARAPRPDARPGSPSPAAGPPGRLHPGLRSDLNGHLLVRRGRRRHLRPLCGAIWSRSMATWLCTPAGWCRATPRPGRAGARRGRRDRR